VELVAKGGCESLSVQILVVKQPSVIEELNLHCSGVKLGLKHLVTTVIAARVSLVKLVFIVMNNPREICFFGGFFGCFLFVCLLCPMAVRDCVIKPMLLVFPPTYPSLKDIKVWQI